MFCKFCGKQNSDDAVFCVSCGKAIGTATKPSEASPTPKADTSTATAAKPAKAKATKKSKSTLKIAVIAIAATLAVSALTVAACIFVIRPILDSKNATASIEDDDKTNADGTDNISAETSIIDEEIQSVEAEYNGSIPEAYERPQLIKMLNSLTEEDFLNPSVQTLIPNADLSNVVNLDQFYIQDNVKAMLGQNGFVVHHSGMEEFFGLYEGNRYVYTPNFVTVDSLMHTYHLYFQYLLKTTEKEKLADTLVTLSTDMLTASQKQYEELKGTQWETAALRNVAFFGVGNRLLNTSAQIPAYASDLVNKELSLISDASAIELSPIFVDVYEDYSQYIPRGYYEGDPTLEAYFKAMMWYGRMSFEQKDEDSNRAALLMSIAMEEFYSEWESIYAITSFFAGASDDLGYCEYMPVAKVAFNDDLSLRNLIDSEKSYEAYSKMIRMLHAPQINSIPIEDGESNVIPCFRFMGQRFTIDEAIMQQLVYQNVGVNSANEKRMMPTVMDVAASLGSEEAENILRENGDFEYNGYAENLAKMQDKYQNAPENVWNASLYSKWLSTLTPLLEKKGEGYPFFMQNTQWERKEIETFSASYAELKHDTILYSKQMMVEMGDGEIPVYDDRGYVEPQPLVYSRFVELAKGTRDGLEEYGLLPDSAREELNLLVELAEKLLTISEKELAGQSLTAEEYDLIRCYGGSLEHFWKVATIGMTGDPYPTTQIYPCLSIADIATNPDSGTALEVGTGGADEICVIVPVEGQLRLAYGVVYSYYEFEWNAADRLTDTRWRQMSGFELYDDGYYHNYEKPAQPEWTQSFRVHSEYDDYKY